MVTHDRGYTLVELVVVIGIFLLVMAITTVSFNKIVVTSGRTSRSAQTDIEGLIGLEVLRVDLELAGFGLPWWLPDSFTYSEALDGDVRVQSKAKTDAGRYNDAPSNVPRAVVVDDNIGLNNSDYLVLKGTALGMSQTARRWSYLTYSAAKIPSVKPPRSQNPDEQLRLGDGERVIVVQNQGVSNPRELVVDSDDFSFPFTRPNSELKVPLAYAPKEKGESYIVYGVVPEGSKKLRFPFNRADYYIKKPSHISARCAENTGVLYKAVLRQADNDFNEVPLLDCVADMQVQFVVPNEIDNSDDVIDPDMPYCDRGAANLREKVREIRVYILAQDGKVDRSYGYPAKTVRVGHNDFDLAQIANYQHYRWRVYTIVVRPNNFQISQ